MGSDHPVIEEAIQMADAKPQPAGTEEDRRRVRRNDRFRLSSAWIAVALLLILLGAQVVGAMIHNLNQTRMWGIFAIGVVSFLGVLTLGHQGERYRAFDSGEVRTALTTAFAMVFFAAVAIFLFSTNTVGDFGRSLMTNLTSLFGVVIGFYFASSAVVEYGKIQAKKAAPDTPADSHHSTGDHSALEAKVEELQALVAKLIEGSPAPDGHGKAAAPAHTPAPAEQPAPAKPGV
jgi:cation transport ATPase